MHLYQLKDKVAVQGVLGYINTAICMIKTVLGGSLRRFF